MSLMWAVPVFGAALIIVNDHFPCFWSQDMDALVSMSLMWAVPVFGAALVSKGYSELTHQLSRFRV